MLRRQCGLLPGHSVLDAGCGLGRIAVPLTEYLAGEGRYEGFDIDAAAIRWCQENITPAHPNFRFVVSDIHNRRYNPGGTIQPEAYTYPYADAQFDVVLLASVFTHLFPATVRRYLAEISRVLKPGGRCVASFFLLNERSERAIADGGVHERYRFPHEMKGCRVKEVEIPEQAVAQYEPAVRAAYEAAGLKLDRIRYGRWGGGAPGFNQDLIFSTKP